MRKKLFILSFFVLLMTALTGCGYVAEFGNEPYLAGDGMRQDYYKQSLYFTEDEMPGMFDRLKKVGLDFGHTSLNNLLCGLVCDGSVRDVKKSEIIDGKDYHMFSPFYFDVAYQPKMKINAVEGGSGESRYTYFEFTYSDYEYLWKRDGINVKASDMDFAKVKFNKATELKYLNLRYLGTEYTYKEYAKKCGIDIKDYMEHNGTYDEKTDTVTWDLQKMNGKQLYLKIDIKKMNAAFKKYFNSKDDDSKDDSDSEDDKGSEEDSAEGSENNNKPEPKYKNKGEAQRIVDNNLVKNVKVKYKYASGRKIQVNWNKNNNLDGYKVVASFGAGNMVYREVGKDTDSTTIVCPNGKSSASVKVLGYKKYQDKNGNVEKCYISTSKASKVTPDKITFPKNDSGKCRHSFVKQSDDKYYSSYTTYKCKKKNCNVSYKCKRAKTKITFRTSRTGVGKKSIKISLTKKPSSSKVSYYQIRYSTKKSDLTGKTKKGTPKKVRPGKMPYTIKNLNTTKYYYIIVRPVRVKKNGDTLYGSWSNVVKVNKVKKNKK